MTRKKILIAVGIVVVLGAIIIANLSFKSTSGVSVTLEKIERRDLEAIVSVSGKIQPKKLVNVSAETSGKVVDLAVEEGDKVTKGQFLLQIDPRNLQSQFDNRQASRDTAQSQLEQTRQQVENARLAVKQAEDSFSRVEGLYKGGLIDRQSYENAQNTLTQQKTNLRLAETSVLTQETRIKQEQANLESAKYDLGKVRLESPITGIVTKRNIESGETAMIGTMNNAGTVLLTIADMSVIEAEVDVDENSIPLVKIGQVAKITIDALPDKTFPGKVTEVGHSPISAAAGQRATNFRVVVTIEGLVPDVRPGFTCTAVITTATRQKAVAVPIQAATLREMIVDEKGQIVRPEVTPGPGGQPAPRRPLTPMSTELKPGQSRKELEGVFVVKDGRAVYTPIKTGIIGEKYFEVLDGLKEGDEVITGPFASVRNLKDGDLVKPSTTPGATSGPAAAK